MKIIDVYKNAVTRLSEAEIENPAFDAKILFEHVFSLTYSDIIINPDIVFDEGQVRELDKLIDERLSGRPLQYIVGKWDFMGFEFEVGEGVLIPRSETEILVEYTVDKLRNIQSPVIYDLCSGSGCIGLSVKKLLPSARVFMIEISDEALFYLNKNRENLGLMKDTCVIKGDILRGYEAFSSLPEPDVILSNPPYVRRKEIETLQKEVQSEPSLALDGGEDGLDFYRILSEKWLPFINNGGYMAVECGEEQADEISAMFMKHCDETEILNDFSYIQRVVIGKK
ncbi:MAG: peptide chain release factor N(5)-glutamine methyltransferase [Acutalibacteraceae bacterium]